jgi:hypothetical protein
MRDQINTFLCTNPNPTAKQYEKIIRNFISSNLRQDEAEKIFKDVPEDYNREKEKIKINKPELEADDEDHAYFIAWSTAFDRANMTLDKYYRIKGNEVRIAVVSKFGFNPDGIQVEFADADQVSNENRDIVNESLKSGVE